MNDLKWLSNWFKQHCDGDWEHFYEISIGTLDNPGWYISINLEETELERKIFDKLKIERTDTDWCHCFIREKCFEIACGVMNLEEGLKIFRKWVEQNEKSNENDYKLKWLSSWFKTHCDGDWEHSYGITIETTGNPGWKINISLEETELENKTFDKIKIYRNEKDWCYCYIKEKSFEVTCGIMNLEEGIKIFQTWIEEKIYG